MALAISHVPVLTGEVAERFEREAEYNEKYMRGSQYNPGGIRDGAPRGGEYKKVLRKFEEVSSMNIYDCLRLPLGDVPADCIERFDCGREDINNFFHHDVERNQKQMFGKTYFLRRNTRTYRRCHHRCQC